MNAAWTFLHVPSRIPALESKIFPANVITAWTCFISILSFPLAIHSFSTSLIIKTAWNYSFKKLLCKQNFRDIHST